MSERDEFEAVFPMPPDTIRCGEGYAVTSYNAWQGMEFCAKWKGWKAARDTAKQAAVPVAWATVLPSGAIHAMRAKKADAERRTDAWNQDHPRPPLAVTKPLAFSTPQQAMPEGWKLVPVEPTESMRLAPAKDRPGFSRNVAAEIYRSMLAAAPQPSQEPEHQHYWGYFTDTKTYRCRCGAETSQYPLGPADYKD